MTGQLLGVDRKKKRKESGKKVSALLLENSRVSNELLEERKTEERGKVDSQQRQSL